MPLYFNPGSGLVTSQIGGDAAVQVSAARGATSVNVILVQGDPTSGIAPVLLDSSFQVAILLRDPENFKVGYFAGPLVLTRGASATDGYLGTFSTDTDVVRVEMNVTGNDPAVLSYPLEAVLVIIPASGPPQESQPFPWTVTASFYDPGVPPANYTPVYPGPEQLQGLVALVANVQPKLPTPTAVGQFLFGNPDRSFSFGVFPTGLSPTFAALTTTGPISVAGAAEFKADVQVDGALSATSVAGDGSALTNLNPTALSGPVPLNKLPAAVAGGFHYAGAWDANANTPPLLSGQGTTGAVYRVSVAGGTALDGINTWLVGDELAFDGAHWDKFNGAGNEVVTVDGTAPVDGAVTLPGDQAADVPSKRTLGTGATQAAPGDDSRFPASVTGLRKGDGAGGDDVAALAGVDYLAPNGDGSGLSNVAPLHFVDHSGTLGGVSGNGTILSFGANVNDLSSGAAGVFNSIDDRTGHFYIQVTAALSGGATVATITFHTPYPGYLPANVMITVSLLSGTSPFGMALLGVMTAGSLAIKTVPSGAGANPFPTGTYFVQYNIPPS